MYQSTKTVSYCALCDRKIHLDDVGGELRGEFKWIEDLGHVCAKCQSDLEFKQLLLRLDEMRSQAYADWDKGKLSNQELTLKLSNIELYKHFQKEARAQVQEGRAA